MIRLILLLGGSPAVSIVVKATVIAAFGLIGAWLGRGSRAAVRHAVLAASFAALLALPVVSLLVPTVHIAVAQAQIAPSLLPESIDTPTPGAPMARSVVVSSRWSVPPVGDLLFAAWMVGVVFFLLRIIVGLRQVRVLRRFGLPWREGQIVVERMAVDAGVHRHVEVLLHESLAVPVTCGVVRPAIMLPPDARNWDGEDLGRAIMHELEHVRRWDWVSQCCARVVCAVYWFHPLVWIAWRQLALEAERACDDAVLGRSEGTAYADQLIELAQRLSRGRKSPALAMANRSDLSSRVRAVLDGRQQRGRAGAFLVMVAGAVAAAVVLTMSPLRAIAAPQSGSAQSAANALEFEVATVKPFDGSRGGWSPFLQGGPGTSDPNRITYTHNLKRILTTAYGVGDEYISGPGWLDAEMYEITATIRPGATKEQMLQMLQNLLKQRLQMTIHRETRDEPLYELTVAGKGPQLKEYVEGSYAGTFSRGLPQGLDFPFQYTSDGINHALANKVSIAQLTKFLSFQLKRPVVDKTGLTGMYNYVLDFVPAIAGADENGSPAPAPDLTTAVRVQLGLKLTARKGAVEIIVVDHAEKTPIAN